MGKSYRNLSLIFCLALCIYFLTGCGGKAKLEANNEAVPVKVMKAELKDMQKNIEYVGSVRAQDEAVIYPKVGGKVLEKLKEDGARVFKGDVVAYIDRDEVGFKFEKAPVESPLTGIIGRFYVDKGASVTTQTAIALVVDMDKVKINLDMPGMYLHSIKPDQQAKITVDAWPEDVFTGNVTKISPVIDMDTRTAPVEITINNQLHRLKSGMFANVQLPLEEHKAVVSILKEAVIGKASFQYVFIVKDNKAILRNIKIGIQQGPYLEITDGVKAGDPVVIAGQQRLKDGVSVAAEE